VASGGSAKRRVRLAGFPCVDGQERDGNRVELPLAAVGIALQMSLGGAFLAGGQLAARRRAGSVG
jgi:hypothetical protein